MTEIGDQIARRRGYLRMSQKELAERVGVTRQAISNIETGRSMPRLQTLDRINRIFDHYVFDDVRK